MGLPTETTLGQGWVVKKEPLTHTYQVPAIYPGLYDGINLTTAYYGKHRPHFYFFFHNRNILKCLTDLFQSQACKDLGGEYFGQNVSQYGYPSHGVHFRLHQPEHLEEFFELLKSVIKLPPEVMVDITAFIDSQFVLESGISQRLQLREQQAIQKREAQRLEEERIAKELAEKVAKENATTFQAQRRMCNLL